MVGDSHRHGRQLPIPHPVGQLHMAAQHKGQWPRPVLESHVFDLRGNLDDLEQLGNGGGQHRNSLLVGPALQLEQRRHCVDIEWIHSNSVHGIRGHANDEPPVESGNGGVDGGHRPQSTSRRHILFLLRCRAGAQARTFGTKDP